MGQLDYLANIDVRHPVAHTWNAMLKEVAQRLVKRINVGPGSAGTFIHPFYTTATPWDDLPKNTPYDPKRMWRVDVVPGCVNDVMTAIAYQAKSDPRGWTMPKDYPFDPGDGRTVIDRPLYDQTDPAPFLVMESPSLDGSDLKTFIPVPDSARPPFFQTEEMWAQTLYRTSVMVSSSPALVVAFNPALPRRLVQRYRVFIGKPQTALVTNVKEIARLYLTRDPVNNLDSVYGLQEVYWDLQAMIVQSGMTLFASAEQVRAIGVDPVSSIYGSLVADDLVQMAMNMGYTAWWNA